MGVLKREVESVGQAVEEPLATPEEHGNDKESILVDEAVRCQGGREDRASNDGQILSGLLFHASHNIRQRHRARMVVLDHVASLSVVEATNFGRLFILGASA